MIYFTTEGGSGAVMVMEPGEIERILRGIPIRSPDGNLLVCYTPDMEWTQKEFNAMLALNGGAVEAQAFDSIIRMGLFRERVMK